MIAMMCMTSLQDLLCLEHRKLPTGPPLRYSLYRTSRIYEHRETPRNSPRDLLYGGPVESPPSWDLQYRTPVHSTTEPPIEYVFTTPSEEEEDAYYSEDNARDLSGSPTKNPRTRASSFSILTRRDLTITSKVVRPKPRASTSKPKNLK